MADKIQVAVRVRPVLFQKKDVEIHWGCEQGMVVQLEPGTKKRIGHPYLFNHVFGTDTKNHQIFEAVVQPLIDSAMDGFNVTVLAYGQTASGKTYTMMGSQKELGIVQLAVDRMFDIIEKNPERAFLLRCSYIEIYNETISDLLSSTPHQKLKVQELAEGHVVVHNLTETNVNTPDAVVKLMQQGNKQRKVGGTSMNERSSRSHTIFRIIVESVPRDEADRTDAAVMVSHINLVDLAGSEKASQTNATGDRFREGCAINTSLSALSLVIKQLSEGEGFVNFRDSKLTHILRASLGGNARTAIICNVTPTVLEETSSTLKFASSAKTVSNQPHVNEILSDQALLRKYTNYIKDLEKKLKEKELEKKPGALEEMQRLLREKDMKIHELKEQLVVSSCTAVAVCRPEDSLTSTQRSLRRMTWGGNRLKKLNFTDGAFETPIFPRARMANFSSSELALDEDTLDSGESEAFFPAECIFPKATTPSTSTVNRVDASTMTESLLPLMPSVMDSPAGGLFKRPCTPSTPAHILRERVTTLRQSLKEKEIELNDVREELDDLTNFTRLEKVIGVHHPAATGSCSSQESADQLHQAQQTANDMEVLYLDTQRKFSELQTEHRTKVEEYEAQLQAQKTTFQKQLDTESNEKKRLAKELNDLKMKYERLEMDHAEADTHVQVLNERHAKREAELRQTLQEAWSQLEQLGQDPKAVQDSSALKQQLGELEKRLQESDRLNEEAQARIDSLTEELRQAQLAASSAKEELAQTQKIASRIKDEPAQLDNSLSGMCLADELRDVLADEPGISSPFFPRSFSSTVRPRKRPSSILSVALAKMEQSASMLDASELMEVEAKKTRLSVQPSNAAADASSLETNEVKELGCIRDHLVELQGVLERYEAEFELLSREKEVLTAQLATAQNDMAALRVALEEEKNKASKTTGPAKLDGSFRSAVGVDLSSCSNTADTSNMDVEHSAADEDEPFVSSDSLPMPEEDDDDKTTGEQQKKLAQLTDQLHRLQDDIDTKNEALDEARRSLKAAQATIADLEQQLANSEENNKLVEQLDQAVDRIQELESETKTKTAELDATRLSIEEARNSIRELADDNESLKSQFQQLSGEKEELEARLHELQMSVERVDPAQIQALQDELAQALENANSMQAEINRLRLVEEASAERQQRLAEQLEGLEQALEAKNRQIGEVQQAADETIRSNQQFFEMEKGKWQVEVNRAMEERREMEVCNEQLKAELNEAAIKLEELQQQQTASVEAADTTDLQTTLEEMQASLHEFRLSSEQLQTQVADLEAELQSKKAEAEDLGRKLQVSEENAERYRTALEEASTTSTNPADLEALFGQIKDKEEKILRLQSDLDEVRKQADQTEELGRLIEQKDEDIRQLRDAADQAAELGRQLEVKEEEALRLRSVLEEASAHKDQLEELGRLLEQKEEEIRSAQAAAEQAVELTVQLDAKEREILRLQSSLEEALSHGAQSEEVFQKLEQKEEEIRCLQAAIVHATDLAGQLEAKEQEVLHLKSTLEEALARGNQSEELSQLLEQKEEEIRQLQPASERAEELARQLAIKEEEVQQLQLSLEEALARGSSTEGLSRQLEQNAVEIRRLQSVLEQSEELNRQKEEEIHRLQSVMKAGEAAAEELELQLKTKADEIHRLQVATEEAVEFGRQLESKEEEIQRLKSALEQTLAGEEERVKDLSNQLSVKEEEICQLKLSLEETQSRAEQLVARCELDEAIEKVQEMERVVEVTRLAAAEAERKALAEVQEIQDRLTRLGEELDTARTARESGLAGLEVELNKALERATGLERSLEEKTAQLEAAGENLAAARARASTLEQEASSSMVKLEAVQRDVENLAERNHMFNSQIERLQSDLLAREEELSNLQMVAGKASSLEEHLRRKEAELSALSDALEQKTLMATSLEEELARATAHQSTDQEQLRHLSEKLHERERDLKEVRGALEEMQSANDRLVSKLGDEESARSELERKLESYTQRFQAVEAQLESLRSKEKKATLRIQELEEEVDSRQRELGDLRESSVALQKEREQSGRLKEQVASLQADKEALAHQCGQMREAGEELQRNREQLIHEINVLSSARMALEEDKAKTYSEREAVLADYQRLKASLEEAEAQLETIKKQRDEAISQERLLVGQVGEMKARITSLESGSRHQIQRQLEEANEVLKRELRDARSNCEVLRLNFETEEDQRKKKIDRLEKELEGLKKEYVKCKEQLRLTRHQVVSDEGTVSLPAKARNMSVSTESTFVQTDPIADKGFGFRWQMEQYVSDNERLRKKVSEVGERMEFYKEKLIKYRTLYFELTGQQDQHKRPLTSSSSQPSDRPPSARVRENSTDGLVTAEPDRIPRGKTVTPVPSISSGTLSSLQEGAISSGGKLSASSTASAAASAAPAQSRWPGAKKESLTKEEMEKINNCNPS